MAPKAVLIGLPGSGKSTIGRRLAKALELDLLDTDAEIERRTGLSRNTIRKYLRADTVVPQFKVPDRSSKLDPFAEKLTGWLQIEAGKSRKQKRTAKQMHADLVALGYEGSYNRVAAYVRDWKAGRLLAQQASGRGTYVPLVF